MYSRHQSQALLFPPELLNLSLGNLARASFLVANPARTRRPTYSAGVASLRSTAEDIFSLRAACESIFFGFSLLLNCFLRCCFFESVWYLAFGLLALGAAQCFIKEDFFLFCIEVLAML